MLNDESTTVPSGSTSTVEDEETEMFYELLAEQRYQQASNPDRKTGATVRAVAPVTILPISQ